MRRPLLCLGEQRLRKLSGIFQGSTRLDRVLQFDLFGSKIEAGIEKPNNIFWIAFVDHLPVGYAKLKLNSKSEFIESKDVCQLQKSTF